MKKEILSSKLACPKCKYPLETINNKLSCTNLLCDCSTEGVLKINSKLVLIDFENSIISLNHVKSTAATSPVARRTNISRTYDYIRKALNGNSSITLNNIKVVESLLLPAKERPTILIVGGGTIGAGLEEFILKYKDSIISFDVYDSPNIDFIADGHSIPLLDSSVDVVIIQAVLEHVLQPSRVVSECYRVLREHGVIYSETPFMQQVHEGAYDFTRFTVLGHRLLFKDFVSLRVGSTSGLGQSLLWSLEYFVSGIFRSRVLGKLIKLLFFWVRWLESIIPIEWNNDGACGCYFLGKKTSIDALNYNELLKEFRGVVR
jgi:SAM-dependent methyltransferase